MAAPTASTFDIKPRPRTGVTDALSEQAHKAITELIRTRRLKGGDAVVEQKLADSLGISRTPLREALQRLEGEGLVVKSAGRSYAVRQVDLSEYLQSLKTREVLEGEAAALAAGRIPAAQLRTAQAEIDALRKSARYHTTAHWRSDDHVHNLFADHCGNQVMAGLIKGLRVTTRLFEIANIADRVDPDSDEHSGILDALGSGDPKAARRAAQVHIRSLMKHALADLS
ncbi:MAG: GntR family transcriptional regulator [Devosia sp.]